MRARRFGSRRALLVAVLVLVAVAAVAAAIHAGRGHTAPPASAQAAFANLTSSSAAQQFSGQVTDAGCGSTNFTADPSSTINVTVTA